MQNRRRKKEKQDLRLKDDTDFIRISLWGNDTKQLRGISNGDSVRVTNVKTNNYYDTVSLNSTDFTRIYKVAASTRCTASVRSKSGNITGSKRELLCILCITVNNTNHAFIVVTVTVKVCKSKEHA